MTNVANRGTSSDTHPTEEREAETTKFDADTHVCHLKDMFRFYEVDVTG